MNILTFFFTIVPLRALLRFQEPPIEQPVKHKIFHCLWEHSLCPLWTQSVPGLFRGPYGSRWDWLIIFVYHFSRYTQSSVHSLEFGILQVETLWLSITWITYWSNAKYPCKKQKPEWDWPGLLILPAFCALHPVTTLYGCETLSPLPENHF